MRVLSVLEHEISSRHEISSLHAEAIVKYRKYLLEFIWFANVDAMALMTGALVVILP